jgi:hypothetical protein
MKKEDVALRLELKKYRLDIISSVLLPATLLCISLGYEATQKGRDEARVKAEKIVEKRIELWGKIAEPLNGIYCYFLCVGDWKRLHPTNIISFKRETDRIVFSYYPFLSDDFHAKYNEFVGQAFKMYTSWGLDAKLRTIPYRSNDINWDSHPVEPSNYFETPYQENRTNIYKAYYELLGVLNSELDMPPNARPKIPDMPINGTPKIPLAQ